MKSYAEEIEGLEKEEWRVRLAISCAAMSDKSYVTKLSNSFKDSRKSSGAGLKVIDDPEKLKALKRLKEQIAKDAN